MISTKHEMIDLRVSRLLDARLSPAIYPHSAPVDVAAWEVPGEPVPFADAVTQRFTPIEIGSPWGRPWGTTWLHATGVVPPSWADHPGEVELLVDLGFRKEEPGFQAEGLVYASDGRIIKALEPLNNYVRLASRPGEAVDLFIEAASNPDLVNVVPKFAATDLGRKETAGDELLYRMRTVELALFDRGVWELVQDLHVVLGLARTLASESPRAAALFGALDAAVDAVDPADVSGSAAHARSALASVLAAPASASAHAVVAVGHAHIDSAWLWPVRETIRKCARTFSNVLDLMDQYPDFTFACSSAQQFAWIQRHYPSLFDRIIARVREGRFIPVGGMWVESDTNMPGGEALVRQFVIGGDYFEKELGVTAREVWLPDSFGYTAALPQIAREAGAEYFLTQKLSWNETNRMPHHTFEWEGIDGSTLVTHFTPADTYNSQLTAPELSFMEANFADSDLHNSSLALFGFGDGGGGPTREMMAAAHRSGDLEGLPTVRVGTPQDYFSSVPRAAQLPRWTGELYLEFHRGTYTSQARTKRGNRRSESLLHDAELWAATAAVRTGAEYPYQELRAAWETVLLQQFHDILPGSSIGWVHDQAVENYERVSAQLNALIDSATDALAGAGEEPIAFNSSPFTVAGVPPYGSAPVVPGAPVAVIEKPDGWIIAGDRVTVTVDRRGLIVSLIDSATGRETIPAGTAAGLLQSFRDTPSRWDAWDIDIDYRKHQNDLVDADAIDVRVVSVDRVDVVITRTFSASVVTQTYSVIGGRAAVDIETDVDWHERETMLKLAVPVDVHSTSATSEIQFGHIVRPTHTNTSWDTARFETVAHKWVHVSDASFGVGVANDSTYGHDITRHPAPRGGTYTLVRQTLLRAPLYPDPQSDQGRHVLRSSIVVGDVGAAIEDGYRLDRHLRERRGTRAPALFSSSDPAVIVETVKLADDESGDVIVRLYEARGARASTVLDVRFDCSDAVQTDLRERAEDRGAIRGVESDGVHLDLRAFQIVTLRFRRRVD